MDVFWIVLKNIIVCAWIISAHGVISLKDPRTRYLNIIGMNCMIAGDVFCIWAIYQLLAENRILQCICMLVISVLLLMANIYVTYMSEKWYNRRDATFRITWAMILIYSISGFLYSVV